MAIDYFHIKERDFDLVEQLIQIEADAYDEEEAFDAFELAAMLRHGRVYVAVENETVIGSVYFMRNFDNAEKAFLHSINIVDPQKYANLGVSLLSIAFTDMKTSGIKSVEVNVDAENVNALKKYREQLGFVPSDKLESEIFGGSKLLMLKKEL